MESEPQDIIRAELERLVGSPADHYHDIVVYLWIDAIGSDLLIETLQERRYSVSIYTMQIMDPVSYATSTTVVKERSKSVKSHHGDSPFKPKAGPSGEGDTKAVVRRSWVESDICRASEGDTPSIVSVE
jgi:hypothetical protein